MLIRQRCKARGPREIIYPEVGTRARKAQQNSGLAIVETRKLTKSQSAAGNRKITQKKRDLKVFKQPEVRSTAFDNNIDRVGSVSPFKYRPRIDMDGLQEEEFYQRKHMYDRMNTPDGYRAMMTPKRSARSQGGGALNRSNSRKSILKSNTHKTIDGS